MRLSKKIKECDKNANSNKTDTECANAYKARYSKSSKKPRESAVEFFESK